MNSVALLVQVFVQHQW